MQSISVAISEFQHRHQGTDAGNQLKLHEIQAFTQDTLRKISENILATSKQVMEDVKKIDDDLGNVEQELEGMDLRLAHWQNLQHMNSLYVKDNISEKRMLPRPVSIQNGSMKISFDFVPLVAVKRMYRVSSRYTNLTSSSREASPMEPSSRSSAWDDFTPNVEDYSDHDSGVDDIDADGEIDHEQLEDDEDEEDYEDNV